MTSILKAQQEMERRRTTGEVAIVSSIPHESWERRPSVLLLVSFLVAGSAGLMVWSRSGSAPPEEPSAVPVAVGLARAPEAPPHVPPHVPPRGPAPHDHDVPLGRVQARIATAPPAAPAPAAERPAVASAQRESGAPRPRAGAVTQPASPPRVEAPAARLQSDAPARPLAKRPVEEDAAAPAAEPEKPASSSGAPRIEVSAIAYSSDVAKRSVTIRIDGGPAVTLHEGESVSGIDVQLILQTSVYVRHGGNIANVGLSR